MTASFLFPRRLGAGLRQAFRYVYLDSLEIVRQEGWRALLRRRGWKFFAAVAAYYVVRDSVLYILVPLWVTRGWR